MKLRMFASVMTGTACWSTSLLLMAAFSNENIIANAIEAAIIGFVGFAVTKVRLDEVARKRMVARKRRRKEMEGQKKRASLSYYEYDEKALKKLRALRKAA